MLAVAAWIPDAAARDQFADRIAHKARITEEVVRAEIRKAAVSRQTDRRRTGSCRASGSSKHAEKALIWWLIHTAGRGLRARWPTLEDEDLRARWPRESSNWRGLCTDQPPSTYHRR